MYYGYNYGGCGCNSYAPFAYNPYGCGSYGGCGFSGYGAGCGTGCGGGIGWIAIVLVIFLILIIAHV